MTGALLRDLGPAGALLVGLFFAHVVSDFLVQTRHVAAEKTRSARVLLWHGLLTLVTWIVLLTPFLDGTLLIGLLLLAGAHIAIDRVKPVFGKDGGRALAAFFIDQGLHAVAIGLAWGALVAVGVPAGAWWPLPIEWLGPAARAAVIAAGCIFIGPGGAALVRLVLDLTPGILPGTGGGASPAAMGRTIGVLERQLAFVLILVGQWGALGFILAAKSIARFKELDDRTFADYYLIGTLTSLLIAVVVGVAVRALL